MIRMGYPIGWADQIRTGTHCDLCGADIRCHGRTVASGDLVLSAIRVRIQTVICRNCRFVFQREQLSDALLSELYKSDASFDFGTNEGETARVKAGLLERQAVISTAMNAAQIHPPARVLDIGGGRGECCVHLLHSHRVVVADATTALTADPRIDKLPGLLTSNIGEAKFEVVIMNHVLEHVFSPTALLNIGYKSLTNRGILIVEVPFELYTPLVRRHLGDWRHVAYFSRHTLRQFLEKSGFFVTRLELELGIYGARRLPVIRAVAHKRPISVPPARRRRHHYAPLLADMAAPVVLASLAGRILGRT